MKIAIASVVLLLTLTASAAAQQPATTIKLPPRFSFSWADGLLVVGTVVDDHYAMGKREVFPLVRDGNKLYSRPRYVGYSLVIGGAFKTLEAFYRKPEERRLIRIVEGAFGVTRLCVGLFHNRQIKAAR